MQNSIYSIELVKFLKDWADRKVKEGFIPTVELLIEELEQIHD